jgi:deazaflavin-dependent oxidoreductase (nitroreductase family)
MTTEPTVLRANLRQFFKYFNRYMLLLWRLGLGRWMSLWPEGFGQYMVITHTGRKTGLRRQTPVNYAEVCGDVYCVAGFGPVSDWYRNLKANPRVEVWLPYGWWEGTAEEVTGTEGRIPILREVIIGSGFAGRAAGLDPFRMSDEALDYATADYRLIRIRREAPRTGKDGPGDLAWVWPLATMLLLPLVFRRLSARPKRTLS